MLPRRNFLQFLGLAAAAPVAAAAVPAEASRYGMTYVTGSAALSGADLTASEVAGSMAQMASGHPDMENELSRTLDAMRQAKDRSKPIGRRDLASAQFSMSFSAEAANIDSLRSVSDTPNLSGGYTTRMPFGYSVANRLILAGEELTDNYFDYDVSAQKKLGR